MAHITTEDDLLLDDHSKTLVDNNDKLVERYKYTKELFQDNRILLEK